MIDTATALYCVMGSPVAHSKSPLVHNKAFRHHGIDAVYLAFEPKDIGQAMAGMRSLGIKGASITIPYKEAVMAHLDWIEPMARNIGAVNTVVNDGGRLLGYNTDWKAAVAPLMAHGLQGKRVCIVGAGGAARAVATGVADQGAHVIVTNRTREKGEGLAARVKGEFIPAREMARIRAHVVINTTSLGMDPRPDVLSFPARALNPSMVVMDVVYTPLETRLITTAREKGCTTIDGLSMFLAQAGAQFRLWTGIDPDIDQMRNQIRDQVLQP